MGQLYRSVIYVSYIGQLYSVSVGNAGYLPYKD